MSPASPFLTALTLAPVVLMLAGALLAPALRNQPRRLWSAFVLIAAGALAATATAAALRFATATAGQSLMLLPGLASTPLPALLGVLVQLLGTTIGSFSGRYLHGEADQGRYAAALAAVLAAVHVLLLADHWLVLILAWAAIGVALQQLLCFYRERPFALLAAHKKRIADRIADLLLLAAAAMAWSATGSGSLAALRLYLQQHDAGLLLQASGVCLALAVMLRTALLPLHGWLIQVMEAPTPVSALLHAGVVNLGGCILIGFAPLLEAAPVARWLLIAGGLATAVLAGLVMLTRVSIKVRLAWSTVAQMGFMVLECGLGLYSLAALHLIGHSLYKVCAFLASSGAVRDTRLHDMHGDVLPHGLSLFAAPVLAALIVMPLHHVLDGNWPWWWQGIVALAWAPLLWLPAARGAVAVWRTLGGIGAIALLSVCASLAHLLPLGLQDAPHAAGGPLALAGMAALYLGLAAVRLRPAQLERWRRWSYAGFYVDEFCTRLALRWWPHGWKPVPRSLPTVALNTAPTR